MRRRAAPARATVVAAAAGPVVALLATIVGCGDYKPTRDIRATIVDENDRPIPGAILYAEAHDDTGPFASYVGIAGTAGEVPDTAREPGKIPWRKGARITLAAFAEGFRPAVIWREDGPVRTDGALIVLERQTGPADGWSPELVRLSWPLEAAARPAPEDPAAEALSEHLLTAWRVRSSRPEPLTEAESGRLEAILSIERAK